MESGGHGGTPGDSGDVAIGGAPALRTSRASSDRLAGVESPQVTRRLCAALQDLMSVAPPDRQAPLDRQLRLLTAAVHRAYEDEEDIAAALTPDAEGIGSGADVTTPVRLDRATPDAGVRPGARIPG